MFAAVDQGLRKNMPHVLWPPRAKRMWENRLAYSLTRALIASRDAKDLGWTVQPYLLAFFSSLAGLRKCCISQHAETSYGCCALVAWMQASSMYRNRAPMDLSSDRVSWRARYSQHIVNHLELRLALLSYLRSSTSPSTSLILLILGLGVHIRVLM